MIRRPLTLVRLMFALISISMWTACGPADGSLGEPVTDDVAFQQAVDDAYAVTAAIKGNGAPSGSHFTLNLIGVPKTKSADMTGNNGRRIFMPLWGKAKIMLAEGSFQVLDGNGTDGSASFQLPNPDPENSGTSRYSVFARALGKPGGSATMTTCATDPVTGDDYCSIYQSVSLRTKGKSSFSNVTRELLYVYIDLDGDGSIERFPLFDSTLEEYYWDYDNKGLKLNQLRFYPVPTTVN